MKLLNVYEPWIIGTYIFNARLPPAIKLKFLFEIEFKMHLMLIYHYFEITFKNDLRGVAGKKPAETQEVRDGFSLLDECLRDLQVFVPGLGCWFDGTRSS